MANDKAGVSVEIATATHVKLKRYVDAHNNKIGRLATTIIDDWLDKKERLAKARIGHRTGRWRKSQRRTDTSRARKGQG